jgi:GxxExxY protein
MNAEQDRVRQSGNSRALAIAAATRACRDDDRDALPVPEEWNALTRTIIGCAIEVHRHLGTGLREQLYETAFDHELRMAGLSVERQVEFAVPYKDIVLPAQRLDVVVNRLVVIELKAVMTVDDASLAQLVSQLRAARLPIGLLINFHSRKLTDGVYRRLNDRVIPR